MDAPWTLQRLLELSAARGDRPAILSLRGQDLETWSHGEIADRVARLSAGLVQAGIKPGEPVALCGPNGPEWVVVAFAVVASGALLAPIDDLSSGAELAAILADSGARWLFTTQVHAVALGEMPEAPRVKLIALDDGASGIPAWREFLTERTETLPAAKTEAPAILVYTSGTTASPKPFTLSQVNMAANIEAILSERLLTADDRALLPLPLHHAYPFIIGLLTPLTSGAAVVFPEAVTGPQIVEALRKARITVMIGVPRLYTALLDGLRAQVGARGFAPRLIFATLLGLTRWTQRRLGLKLGHGLFRALRQKIAPTLHLMVSGGARLEPEAIETLEALGWEVLSGYGLAETGSVFTGNLPGRKRIGSEGRPLAPGSEVRIATPDEHGDGEIQLRGTSVFSGYCDNPEANRAAFTGDGWFRTGDLGHLDQDGYLTVTGRAKELIVLGGGKNVFPEELEAVYGNTPLIQEAAVLERAGRLYALVVPDLEAIRAESGARVEDVLRVALHELGLGLAPYQRLSGFAIARRPLPRTRLGKYRRFLLPDLYEQAARGTAPVEPGKPTAEDRALLAASPACEIWDLLGARYPDKVLALEASPQLDLGIDSLEWLGLTLELNDRLGIRLTDDDLARIATLRDVLQVAAEAARRAPAPPHAGGLAPEPAHWIAPAGSGLGAFALIIHLVNKLLLRAIFRLRAEGLEHLPRQGPYLLAANHVSDLDPLALAAALPLSQVQLVYWSGEATRLFSNPVTRYLCRALHIFPLDERSPETALALGTAVLRNGNALTWFPESWRSPDGELQRFLPGIGRLLAQSPVPVVPVLIRGTFEAMPRWRRLPRPHPVRVTFGPPHETAELDAAGQGETPESRIVDALRRDMLRLSRSGSTSPAEPADLDQRR